MKALVGFLLCDVHAIERPGRGDRQEDENQDAGHREECQAELGRVVAGPLTHQARPADGDRQGDGQRQHAPRHDATEMVAGDDLHEADARLSRQQRQVQQHAQDGGVERHGRIDRHRIQRSDAVQIPDHRGGGDDQTKDGQTLCGQLSPSRGALGEQNPRCHQENFDGGGVRHAAGEGPRRGRRQGARRHQGAVNS